MNIDDIELFIVDFDGVLTNNLVYLNQSGIESVACSRSDGLAFDVLRKLNKPVYLLSTEKNPVVTERAKKLKIHSIQGVENKADSIQKIVDENGFCIENVLYLGNDFITLTASASRFLSTPLITFTLVTEPGLFTIN